MGSVQHINVTKQSESPGRHASIAGTFGLENMALSFKWDAYSYDERTLEDCYYREDERGDLELVGAIPARIDERSYEELRASYFENLRTWMRAEDLVD